MAIVPTVGRVVLCHGVSQHGPIPGLIVHAWGDKPDSYVNVLAFGDGGNEPVLTPMMSVLVLDPDVQPNPELKTYCTWMPFQKGQAAMTEKIAQAAKLI